jgi:hypothetical protein
MDQFLPRSEIVRQVRAILGMATSDVIATQVGEQHVLFVQMAAEEVATECKWITTRGEVTLDLQEEQQLLDYPENGGPGCVEAMGVWDEGSNTYYPIHATVIPVTGSLDQLEAAGEPTFQIAQGRPSRFEQGLQIRLWPASDKPYKIRVRYRRPANLPTPASMSIVDGLAIVYRAAAMAMDLEDPLMAKKLEARAAMRIAKLRGFHQGNLDIQLNPDADMGEDEHLTVERPRWDTRPTIRPGMNTP